MTEKIDTQDGGDFLRNLGIDPMQVEDGTVRVDIRHGMPLIVRWDGFLIVSPERLAEATEAGKR